MVGMLARHLLLRFALLLFLAPAIFAQTSSTGKLTGTVTDPQGAVVPGAEILARNSQTGAEFRTVGNEVGAWTISPVPSGIYTVRVTVLPGFRTRLLEGIEVGPEAPVVADAVLQIGLADTVIVTASKYEEDIINAPASATVIPEQMIEAMPTQRVADLLRTVPGMNVVQTSALSFGVASRNASGAVAGTQLAMVDSRTIYQDWIGTTWWYGETGLDDIAQMEVIRGPASAIWGSYAMNGVVNIITRNPREMIGTTFTLGLGTFDRSGGAAETDTGYLYYGRATHAQALNDRWAFKISAGAYTQDPFARPQGTIPNDFHTPYPTYTNKGTTVPNIDARVDYDPRDGKQHFKFSGGFTAADGVFPGAAGGADIAGKFGYGKVDYSRGSLRITGYVNTVDYNAKFLVIVDSTGQPDIWDANYATYHFELADSRTVATKHLISYGGSFRHSGFDDLSFAPGAGSRDEGGAYLQDEILLSNRFRWVVGTRIDKFNSLEGVVVSPRTTFMVKPGPGQTFRVSYNRAYVAPSVYFTNMGGNNGRSFLYTLDLGVIDPALAGIVYSFPYSFRGNPDLKEQSLNAYEIGYSAILADGRVSVGAAFYINDSNGDFYWPQTGSYTSQNPPPGWPLPLEVLDAMIAAGMGLPSEFTAANRGRVRNKGVELSADARFNRYMTGHANYSWQARPESKDFDVSVGINLPPNHRFNAGMDFDYGRYLASVSVGYVGSAYWNDILNEYYSGPTKAYTVVNASGGIRWGKGWKYAVMVRVSNLANTMVQNHVYGDILKRQISGEFRIRL